MKETFIYGLPRRSNHIFLYFYQNWKIGIGIGSLVRRDWLWVQILYNISDTVVMSV